MNAPMVRDPGPPQTNPPRSTPAASAPTSSLQPAGEPSPSLAAGIPAGLSVEASSPGLAPPPPGVDAVRSEVRQARLRHERRRGVAHARVGEVLDNAGAAVPRGGYCTASQRRWHAVRCQRAVAKIARRRLSLPLARHRGERDELDGDGVELRAASTKCVEGFPGSRGGFPSRTPGGRSACPYGLGQVGRRCRRRRRAPPVLCVSLLMPVSRLATCRVCRVCAIAGSLAKERSARRQRAPARSALGAGVLAPLRSIERIKARIPRTLGAARARVEGAPPGRGEPLGVAPVPVVASWRSQVWAECGWPRRCERGASARTAPMFNGGATELHTT